MEDKNYLAGRIRELSHKTYQSDYETHTAFLTMSEQAVARQILGYASHPLKEIGGGLGYCGESEGVSFVLHGGYDEAERRLLTFLPSYLDAETYLGISESPSDEALACIRVRPLNAKFADVLTHRDFLGALMNLGIERDQIGDILTAPDRAYIFTTNEMAELVAGELTRVKHTSVMGERVPVSSCDVRQDFIVKEGSIASERLDAVLSLVYQLSRSRAQELIESEAVIADGRVALSAGLAMKPGMRVSVRGHGKFLYEGFVSQTRKGRSFVRVKVYQ